jgi:phosphohistidine phosphatase
MTVTDLYIIRHGIAEDAAPGRKDSQRNLTQEGRERFALVVGALERVGVRPGVVLHSPWDRATQTAAMLAPLTEGSPTPCDLLARPPGEDLLTLLAQHASVAVVGHEPWLSDLAWILAAGSQSPSPIRLQKGGFIWLRGSVEPAGMELRAVVPPRMWR